MSDDRDHTIATATVTSEDKPYGVRIDAGGHALRGDEPVAQGGAGVRVGGGPKVGRRRRPPEPGHRGQKPQPVLHPVGVGGERELRLPRPLVLRQAA